MQCKNKLAYYHPTWLRCLCSWRIKHVLPTGNLQSWTNYATWLKGVTFLTFFIYMNFISTNVNADISANK